MTGVSVESKIKTGKKIIKVVRKNNNKNNNNKTMTTKEIYEETLYHLRARAWAISNKLYSEVNEIKDLVDESTKEKKFLNLDVASDSVKEYGEQLARLGKLSVVLYRRDKGLD